MLSLEENNPIVFEEGLIEKLPDVQGRLTPNAPLKTNTWFRVGGPAEVLFQPADIADLSQFLKNIPKDMPLTFLGAGSNTLIRDGGVPGVVIKLGASFNKIEIEETRIHAGASAMDINIARAARQASLTGLEFLSGIPGSLGGALRMNAGAYGGEIKDVLESVTAVDRQGNIETVGPEIMGMSYRHSAAPVDWIFVRATLKGTQGDPEEIEARMKAIQEKRQASQPIRSRTSGSTFANPLGEHAWKLIDEAGCRGLRIGGAMISEQHCNFMINTGSASAEDLEILGEEVRRRVKEKSGIDLSWEIRIIGIKKEEGAAS